MTHARRCVVAPDKFRASATAPEITSAVAEALAGRGWEVVASPMSDGGEGLVDALGGERRATAVTGPLGETIVAEWSVLEDEVGRLAVIEMANASGLALAGGIAGNDPMAATTRGTGELVRAALDEGIDRIVVGCGGSATTDGGLGAVEAIGGPSALVGVDLAVVCDVRTRFLEAARVFGPQKGADPAAIALLSERLVTLARRYADEFGVDVTVLERGGAAGGLAGGLTAIGAQLLSGFEYVAATRGLAAAIADAALVVTGEGELDATSFSGKVVGEVRALVSPPTCLLVIVGAIAPGCPIDALGDAELVSLSDRFGRAASMANAAELAGRAAAEFVVGL